MQIPSTKIRAYLRAHGACAIVLTDKRQILVTRDIGKLLHTNAIGVWWGQAHTVLMLKRHLAANNSVDVLQVAAQLRVVVTEHAVAVERATRAVERIELLLESARRSGKLSDFNKAYSAFRQRERAEGRRAPPYGRCFNALAKELYRASTGTIDAGLIQRALLG